MSVDEYFKDKLAFDLAKEFRTKYLNYSFKIYSLKNVKRSKWWPHFVKTAEKYSGQKDFDAKEFIRIQFDTEGKVLPFFLPGKKAEQNYKNNFYKEDDEGKKILESIKNSINAITLWARKNKKNYNEFFDVPFALLQNKIDYVSPYYLCFSKSFLKKYSSLTNEEKRSIIPKKELSVKRAYVKQVMNLDLVKEIMKDDFI